MAQGFATHKTDTVILGTYDLNMHTSYILYLLPTYCNSHLHLSVYATAVPRP